jgi:hypothetical protein
VSSLFTSDVPDPVLNPVYWKYFSSPSRSLADRVTEVTWLSGPTVPAPPVPVRLGVEVPDDSQVFVVLSYRSHSSWYPVRADPAALVSGVLTVAVMVAWAPGARLEVSAVCAWSDAVVTSVPSGVSQW